ncbi:hypothetical protein [Siccibacter colletis]|uniref:hypothetical protein n=1 Tax=Siccibacter colletis TaxID=1505757 RepID=UPI0004E26E04|nr:hypothetical protein [Siccibacter colletis]
MNNYFGVICALSLILSGMAHAKNPLDASIWFYNKVSNANVLGKRDPVLLHKIESKFKNVSLLFDNKALTIKNKMLENSKICSVEYASVKKTLSAYFMSNTTTNLYEALYENNGITLPSEINLIISVNPDNSCPSPYDEIIAIGDYLTIIENDYVIFFKKIKDDDQKILSSRNGNLLNFCKEDNPGRIYDGIDSYTCFFPDMNIQESYKLLKNAYSGKQEVLKSIPPEANANYELNGNETTYQWEGRTVLKVTVTGDSERGSYIFHKQISGTSVAIESETQY